jgi:hypothetical protein
MTWLVIVLRVLHIVGGVFWAGAAFVVAGFVLPTVAASGPEGGRFMRRLALERGLTRSMIAAGVVTVLAGLALMAVDSAGFVGVWMKSGMGLTISIGALAALGALVTGFRAAAMIRRLGSLGAAVEARGGPPTPEQVGEMQGMQRRLAAGARAVAVQLLVAVACMAVGRYV